MLSLQVLFPLLHKLLHNINPLDLIDTEEARVRGSTLLCKVYLQHLTPLISLSTFTALWLTILEFMDKYMRVDHSGLLVSLLNRYFISNCTEVTNYCESLKFHVGFII